MEQRFFVYVDGEGNYVHTYDSDGDYLYAVSADQEFAVECRGVRENAGTMYWRVAAESKKSAEREAEHFREMYEGDSHVQFIVTARYATPWKSV